MPSPNSKSMNLALWDLLFRTIDAGSISRAADLAGMERTALSRLIASLESEIGHKLIERMGRRLMPTQTAISARSLIEPQIVALRRSLSSMQSETEGLFGNIRLGTTPGSMQTTGVPLLAQFQELYPNVTFDVIDDDDPEGFMQGQADVMLYYGPVNNPNLDEHWINSTIFIPCASPEYIKAHGMPKSPEALGVHYGIIYTGRGRPHTGILEYGERRMSCQWKTKMRFNNILLAKSAALEGCGIVIDMPINHCYREIAEGRLVPVLEGWHVPKLNDYIAATKEASRLARVRCFIEWYVEQRRAIGEMHRRMVREHYPYVGGY